MAHLPPELFSTTRLPLLNFSLSQVMANLIYVKEPLPGCWFSDLTRSEARQTCPGDPTTKDVHTVTVLGGLAITIDLKCPGAPKPALPNPPHKVLDPTT